MPKGSTRRDKGKGRAVNVSVPEEPQHEHQVEDGAHEHSEPSNVAEPSMDKDSALASLDNPSTETEEQPDKNSHNEMADKTNDELDTLKKVQDAINVSHPFGIKIWKPALYKKSRSVNRNIDELLHAKPGVVETRTLYLHPGNLLWAITFGWWIAVLYAFVAIFLLGPWFLLGKLMSLFSCSSSAQTSTFSTSARHIQILLGMSLYILWPFGKYITRQKTLTEHQDCHAVPSELESLLNSDGRPADSSSGKESRQKTSDRTKAGPIRRWFKRLQGFGHMGRIFYFTYLLTIAPVHLVVTVLCYFMVFPIPMGKLNFLLMRHLLWHPLELTCHSSFFTPSSRSPPSSSDANPSSSSTPRANAISHQERPMSTLFWRQSQSGLIDSPILSSLEAGTTATACDDQSIVLCIYKAVGLNYYKCTLDGINILIVNMLSVVLFTLFDYYYLAPRLPDSWITAPGLLFSFSLVSTIPLAFFIGMAVSSITAQTGSIALGSVINATFGSIIEIILYCLAIMEGKERMVEGAIIGSMLCGLLALPGASMFSGGLKRKEQTFNAKAAGVSTTMLVMAVIGVFSPTIFQMIYGSTEMHCHPCHNISADSKCQKCIFVQPHPTKDPVYMNRTRPFMYVCTAALILTYAIGLWFTLRTHTKKIYAPQKKKRKRKRPLFSSFTLKKDVTGDVPPAECPTVEKGPFMGRMLTEARERPRSVPVFQATPGDSNTATLSSERPLMPPLTPMLSATTWDDVLLGFLGRNRGPESSHASDSDSDEEHDGGHDHPNWSNFKSTVVLLGCTVLYSLIAEVLIGSVDGVLSNFPLDEKVLGLTLFAIAPTVTEFYNAISFAVAGNIALSLEIGSAYAIQVALLQIPALVIFSSWYLGRQSALMELEPNASLFPSKMIQDALHQMTLGLYPTTMAATSRPKVRGFTLIFPQWDLATIVFAVFILSYTYVEGKSNYFKGAMLLLAYAVLLSGFLFVPTEYTL